LVGSGINERSGIRRAEAILQVIYFETAGGVENLDRRNAILVIGAEEVVFRSRSVVDTIREIVRTAQAHRDAVAIKSFEEYLARAISPDEAGMGWQRSEHAGAKCEGNSRRRVSSKV
jgi:hypothetical protein